MERDAKNKRKIGGKNEQRIEKGCKEFSKIKLMDLKSELKTDPQVITCNGFRNYPRGRSRNLEMTYTIGFEKKQNINHHPAPCWVSIYRCNNQINSSYLDP